MGCVVTPLAPPDIALEISRKSARSYEEVCDALDVLERHGWSQGEREILVGNLATINLNVRDAALAIAEMPKDSPEERM